MYLSAPPHPLSGDGMAAARIPTLYCSFCVENFVICVSAGVMYWGDAFLDRIETARIDGTGRRLVGTEDIAHYFAFSLYDGNIYISDWAYKYVYMFSSAVKPSGL